MVLRDARVVDARGARPGRVDILIRGGRISAIGARLDIEALGSRAAAVVPLDGRWVCPGLMTTLTVVLLAILASAAIAQFVFLEKRTHYQ